MESIAPIDPVRAEFPEPFFAVAAAALASVSALEATVVELGVAQPILPMSAQGLKATPQTPSNLVGHQKLMYRSQLRTR
jgi:hypothetical protein